jgi:hypothetical protein
MYIPLSLCYSAVAKTISRPAAACLSRPTCVCVCLPAWLAGWLPVTAHEMFNLQIYWLNQAIVTRTVHFLSLSNLSLSHSLRLKQMKIYRKSLCLQL